MTIYNTYLKIKCLSFGLINFLFITDKNYNLSFPFLVQAVKFFKNIVKSAVLKV